MSRKTKVVGVSVPPEVEQKFIEQAKLQNMTKSEYFRFLLSRDSTLSSERRPDIAEVVREYWSTREQLNQPVRVVGLALVRRGKEVLIVSRAGQDKLVPALKWAFPGGTLTSVDFKEELEQLLPERLGGRVTVGNLLSARVIPESQHSAEAVVALYFATSHEGTVKLDTAVYSDYKWVAPPKVFKYFTTSTSDEVTRYLLSR